MEKLKDLAQWFISQTNMNKILILFIATNIYFYVDNGHLKAENKKLIYGQRYTDSVYVARLNDINRDFQRKIDECNKERMDSHIRQSEMWQKKFEELFKETDQVYKKYREVVKTKGL